MASHELQCVSARFGERAVVLETRNAVVEEAHPAWLDGYDALVIGGSGDYSVHHPNSQAFVGPMLKVMEAALHREMPGFGLCFGHQLLGRLFGSEVVTDPDSEEVGTVSVRLSDAGRECALFEGFPDTFKVHTGHSDCVVSLPSGLDLLASNARTVCQAFQVQGARFFSTQFHPDLTGAEAQSRYLINKQNPNGEVDSLSRTKAEAYHPGEDLSTVLLGRFIDHVHPS